MEYVRTVVDSPKSETANTKNKSAFGCLKKYANSSLIPQEQGAWERAMVEKFTKTGGIMKNKYNNKTQEAIGLFWGAALFIGVLVSVIIGFRGNMRSDWLFAVLVGGCVFLAVGLMAQGTITILKEKDEKEN